MQILTSSLVLAMGTAVRSWAMLAGLLVVAGFSNALTHPAANLALVRSIPIGS